MLTDNLFIFPNAVHRINGSETIKLNTSGNTLRFYLNMQLLIIDTELIENGTSTVILNNAISEHAYVLYNFREILQSLDMTPSEFLCTLGQRCFMQIDKSDNKLFIKAFLLEGMNEMPSDTNDFSSHNHVSIDGIHNLDHGFSWTVRDTHARLVGNELHLTFSVKRSEFWKEPIFINHAGQSVPIKVGVNYIKFKYIPTELVYFGAKNCHYKGRAINIEELLRSD